MCSWASWADRLSSLVARFGGGHKERPMSLRSVLRDWLPGRRAERRFHTLVEASRDVVAVVRADGQLGYLSPAVRQVLGLAPEAVVGGQYADLLHPGDRLRFAALRAAVLAGGAAEQRGELRIRHADQSWRWHEVVVRNLLADPAVRGLVVNHHDVTERRQFQAQLAYGAAHDPLTGLANRAAFRAALDRARAAGPGAGSGPEPGPRAGRDPHHTAVLFVDLNGFNQVNDTWGQEIGDQLLVAVGQLLRRSVLGASTVARLGGDEFGIVLARLDAPVYAQAVARRIIAGLAEPIDAGGRPIQIRASIGVAAAGPDGTPAAELLHRADLALRYAKRQQLNGWRVYADDLRDTAASARPTAADLQQAILADQLRLQYQPIVALDSGDLLGVEALVRWQHPTLGHLSPPVFIPIAEASGLIVNLGEWVLRQACRQVRRWQQLTGPERRLQLSVNLSPRQLDHPSLPRRVLHILAETGLSPSDLILEVTEDALVNDDRAVPALTALRSHGIRIALDDFGTGYSSLRYLTNLPVDILKLDRCFVAELDGTREGSVVAEAVIRLSQALNLDTIAEGIENVAQATELTLLGCPLAQGYHFARPLDADALQQLLDSSWPGLPTITGTAPA
jgi:diguanylate cyclase (GGDEF)-like protein/PAS domain S-box-containing protein